MLALRYGTNQPKNTAAGKEKGLNFREIRPPLFPCPLYSDFVLYILLVVVIGDVDMLITIVINIAASKCG